VNKDVVKTVLGGLITAAVVAVFVQLDTIKKISRTWRNGSSGSKPSFARRQTSPGGIRAETEK